MNEFGLFNWVVNDIVWCLICGIKNIGVDDFSYYLKKCMDKVRIFVLVVIVIIFLFIILVYRRNMIIIFEDFKEYF